MEKYNIIPVSYDPDINGSRVIVYIKCGSVTLHDVFFVQLCGGEYNAPMGCWITTETSDGDLDLESYREGTFNDVASEIIAAAETTYEWYCDKQINDNEEGETWEKVDSIQRAIISVTSSTELRVEQSNLGRFRTYTDNSGFTQPNDCSALPNFEITYFENEASFTAEYSD